MNTYIKDLFLHIDSIDPDQIEPGSTLFVVVLKGQGDYTQLTAFSLAAKELFLSIKVVHSFQETMFFR